MKKGTPTSKPRRYAGECSHTPNHHQFSPTLQDRDFRMAERLLRHAAKTKSKWTLQDYSAGKLLDAILDARGQGLSGKQVARHAHRALQAAIADFEILLERIAAAAEYQFPAEGRPLALQPPAALRELVASALNGSLAAFAHQLQNAPIWLDPLRDIIEPFTLSTLASQVGGSYVFDEGWLLRLGSYLQTTGI